MRRSSAATRVDVFMAEFLMPWKMLAEHPGATDGLSSVRAALDAVERRTAVKAVVYMNA